METQFPVLCSSKPLKPEFEKFEKIPITSDVFKLGRGPQNTLVMPYKRLFKDHCIFKKLEDDWILENCSYSSIKVNGNKLRKGQKRKLHDQDIIKLDSSSELIYTFNKNTARKKRKLDGPHENVKKKLDGPSSTNKDKIDLNTERQPELVTSEQSKKERQIYNDYASRIEKLKGSKRMVKRQKAALKERRDAHLESVRVEMDRKMASSMAQTPNVTEPQDTIPKELLKQNIPEVNKDSPKQEALYRLRARIREQDRVRVREKKELRKLRKETEQLRHDREKKLKELEKQKQTREKELQGELSKLNKKLAIQIEMHESEKRRSEQLLSQQREQKEPATGDSAVDVESELQCSICSELFVRATTLGCSHSFCQYCIGRWRRNKRECPICRAAIRSECRSIVLDSLVEKMTETSEEAKKKRQELVKAREELEARDALQGEPGRVSSSDPNYEFQEQDYYEDFNSDSNSSYYGRESSLEPDPDLLVMEDDDDEEMEDESSEESFSGFSDQGELVDDHYDGEMSAPENYDEHDHSAAGEGVSEPENYDEVENSAMENYDEGEISAPENYDERENSAPENYDDGEISAPENYDEGEISAPENYDEGELSAPENYDEGEISAPENYDDGEISAPENYDEGEISAPENYDEGEISAPENYDEGEISAPEYEEPDISASEENDHDGENYEGENSAPGMIMERTRTSTTTTTTNMTTTATTISNITHKCTVQLGMSRRGANESPLICRLDDL